MLMGGGRALLLQVTHPLVAAGVEQHSNYKADPWSRLFATLDTVFRIMFGTSEQSADAAARLRRRHSVVNGTSPDGTAYDALDPTLLLVGLGDADRHLSRHLRTMLRPAHHRTPGSVRRRAGAAGHCLRGAGRRVPSVVSRVHRLRRTRGRLDPSHHDGGGRRRRAAPAAATAATASRPRRRTTWTSDRGDAATSVARTARLHLVDPTRACPERILRCDEGATSGSASGPRAPQHARSKT